MSRPQTPAPSAPVPPGYWALVAEGEPFRLLFPLGAACAILGALLWPLFIWNFLSDYPGQSHPRVMVEGFLTCFVAGFAGTALPRLLGAPVLRLAESLAVAVALTVVVALHFGGQTLAGDAAYLLTLLGLAGIFGLRILRRTDCPPPSFVLIGLGFLCALTGVVLLILSGIPAAGLPPRGALLGRLLLFQGFILLPIMGVGAFLLPRFFGAESRQDFPESRSLPPGWMLHARYALVCGLTIVVSLVLEATGAVRWGMILRALGVFAYVAREVPFHRMSPGEGSLTFGLRLALVSIPVGYALMAVWPGRVFSFLHVVFLTGFGLLTLIVGSRVILGHSGQTRHFERTMWSVRIFTALIFLAMLLRVSADWLPTIRMSHYAYAALAWIAGVSLWVLTIMPGVCRSDPDD